MIDHETGVYPVQFIKSMEGKSNPQLIQFSDGLDYVVKFKNNHHGTRSLANEYVVGRLAQTLSLPVPPFRILCISRDFIQEHPELSQYKFEAGNQFASLYIKNCITLTNDLSTLSREEIKNLDSLAGIIVFDHWVSNTDRGSRNILLESVPQGGYYVHIVDHGKCFPGGFCWTKQTLKENPNKILKKTSNLWSASLLIDKKEMFPFVEKIGILPNQTIYEIIQGIPEDWGVSEEERENLFTYLIEAKKVLPHLIAKFSHKYI